jgi:hypothetical protein
MTIVPRTRFETAPDDLKSFDNTIKIGYAALAIVALIVIYLSSTSSGTAPGDFASMTVFP